MRTSDFPHHITASACGIAVSFYKLVAERGVWDVNLLKSAGEEWSSGTERGREIAMLEWWISAERGIETAQNNLAYVLDQGNFTFLCNAAMSLNHLCFQTRAFYDSPDSHPPLRPTILPGLR